jgi:hypothetical protein
MSQALLHVEQAAIDEQLGTGAVCGVGSKIKSRRSDFDGCSGAAKRYACLSAFNEIVFLCWGESASVE